MIRLHELVITLINKEVYNMTKNEFVKATKQRFAKKYKKQITDKNIKALMDCMFDVLCEGIKKDRIVVLPPYMRFHTIEPVVRHAYHPKTKEYKDVRYARQAKITMGTEFKKRLNSY